PPPPAPTGRHRGDTPGRLRPAICPALPRREGPPAPPVELVNGLAEPLQVARHRGWEHPQQGDPAESVGLTRGADLGERLPLPAPVPWPRRRRDQQGHPPRLPQLHPRQERGDGLAPHLPRPAHQPPPADPRPPQRPPPPPA